MNTLTMLLLSLTVSQAKIEIIKGKRGSGTKAAVQTVTPQNSAREKELDAKEKDLEAREQRLDAREKSLADKQAADEEEAKKKAEAEKKLRAQAQQAADQLQQQMHNINDAFGP